MCMASLTPDEESAELKKTTAEIISYFKEFRNLQVIFMAWNELPLENYTRGVTPKALGKKEVGLGCFILSMLSIRHRGQSFIAG